MVTMVLGFLVKAALAVVVIGTVLWCGIALMVLIEKTLQRIARSTRAQRKQFSMIKNFGNRFANSFDKLNREMCEADGVLEYPVCSRSIHPDVSYSIEVSSASSRLGLVIIGFHGTDVVVRYHRYSGLNDKPEPLTEEAFKKIEAQVLSDIRQGFESYVG